MPNQRFHLAEKKILERLQKELPSNLYYHGYHHTLDVLQAAMVVSEAEKISYDELKLLELLFVTTMLGFYLYIKDMN